MKQTIHTFPDILLEAYLNDLKAEAETVAHIVKFLSDSMTARAELAVTLQASLRQHYDQTANAEPPETVSLTKEVA